MNEEETINAVTAKLTGQFYVGQRVRHSHTKSMTGTILAFVDVKAGDTQDGAEIQWDAHPRAPSKYALWALEPL